MRLHDQEYTLLPISKIDPHPMNPNQGSRDALDDSVDTSGFYGAITVRPKGDRYQILAGEHRWRKLVDEGFSRVPAIVLENVDDVTALRILIADNEVTRRGTMKKDLLARVLDELGSLKGTGIDMSGLEKAETERQEAEDAAAGESDDDSPPEQAFGREYGVLVMADDEQEQSSIFDDLAETYGKDRIRVVSI